jgi:ribosomal protein L31
MKQSLYVSPDTVAKSVHKDVACISCHTDFKLLSASQDHAKIVDFNKTAGISCKNCHQHVNQLREYSQSTHGRLALTGSPKPAPTCADCHGSHDIRSLKKDEAYKDAFHLAGMDVCGKCHKAYADAYNDYYHGRAYKAKATDAPACWDCHGSHQIKPAKDPTSLVSTQRLAKTCGKCHIDSQANFSTQYGPMIHGSQKTLKSTIVMTYLDKALSFIDPMLDSVNGYYKSIVGSLFYRER